MRDRYRTEKDLLSAEHWLNDYLLNRKNPVSERLLYSTRLTDLIYNSFANEELIDESMAQIFNVKNLAQDLFTALYSPVIRRKEDDSVKLRERIINKPIFERCVHNDRFDTLKSLCEDKELPSYDAVSAFCKAFIQAIPVIPNDISGVHYIAIIEELETQTEKAIQELYESKAHQHPMSVKRFLYLYNRIDRKLLQIDNLTKKAEQAAMTYAEALGKSIDVALDAAVDQAEQTHTIMHAWGESSGEMRNTSVNRELLEYVKSSEELQKIARLLGKYREMMADKRKNSYAYGRGEKYDLTTGNDITNCLSSELALLGTAETEILFMRRYEQKRLMQYRKRDAVIKGKGDMIVLIDESSSTRSVAGWAKAFALALLDIAAKDKRKFAMVHFSSADQIKTDLFEPGEYTPQDVMKAAEQFFGGGTNFEVPLKEALWLMENGYENADITIITDGECSVTKEFTQEFREKVTAYKATVTGILLDKSSPCGQSLEPFCDKIYRSKDIAEDEIAVQILNSKVS